MALRVRDSACAKHVPLTGQKTRLTAWEHVHSVLGHDMLSVDPCLSGGVLRRPSFGMR